MPRINIQQIRFGSFASIPGDKTLAYTLQVSDAARKIRSTFMEDYAAPKLSKQYASLVWRYERSNDSYMLIHVQGSQKEFPADARFFSYRSVMEIKREELNQALDFDVYSLLNAIPPIQDYDEVENPEMEQEIPTLHPHVSEFSKLLMLKIRQCILSKQKLFIELDPQGTKYHENGIFQSSEWKELLTAVSLLPKSLRRYATLAFGVDQNYTEVLDDVLIVVYMKGSSLTLSPGVCQITWDCIKDLTLVDWLPETQKKYLILFDLLPGATSSILPLKEMMEKLDYSLELFQSIKNKDPKLFSSEEFALWFQMGNSIKAVSVESWEEAYRVYQTLQTVPGKSEQAKAFIEQQNIEKFGVKGLTSDIYRTFESLIKTKLDFFQKQAFDAYVLESKYGFLFSGGLPSSLKACFTGNWVAQAASRSVSVEKIFEICDRYGALDNAGVKKEIEKLVNVPTSLDDFLQLLNRVKNGGSKYSNYLLNHIGDQQLYQWLSGSDADKNAVRLFEFREAKGSLDYVTYVQQYLNPNVGQYSFAKVQKFGLKEWKNLAESAQDAFDRYQLHLMVYLKPEDLCKLANELCEKLNGKDGKKWSLLAKTVLAALNKKSDNTKCADMEQKLKDAYNRTIEEFGQTEKKPKKKKCKLTRKGKQALAAIGVLLFIIIVCTLVWNAIGGSPEKKVGGDVVEVEETVGATVVDEKSPDDVNNSVSVRAVMQTSKDTIEVNSDSTLKELLETETRHVSKVVVNDTLILDIPNIEFKRQNSLVLSYYDWLVKKIQEMLQENDVEIKIAY